MHDSSVFQCIWIKIHARVICRLNHIRHFVCLCLFIHFEREGCGKQNVTSSSCDVRGGWGLNSVETNSVSLYIWTRSKCLEWKQYSVREWGMRDATYILYIWLNVCYFLFSVKLFLVLLRKTLSFDFGCLTARPAKRNISRTRIYWIFSVKPNGP